MDPNQAKTLVKSGAKMKIFCGGVYFIFKVKKIIFRKKFSILKSGLQKQTIWTELNKVKEKCVREKNKHNK